MNTFEITPGALVVAVDGSPHALRAVQWATAQAHLEGRPLALVHVTGHEGANPTTLRLDTREDEEAWLDDALRPSHLILEEATSVARAADARADVRGISLPGEPRHVLTDLSATAHLLVLGSRGRGTVRSRLLGSVSAAVVKSARCPVVVLRPDSPGRLKDGVVVAADGTAESRPVVEFAFQQASLHGVPLTVLHCVYDVAVSATGMAGGYVRALPDVDEHVRTLAESIAGLAEKYPDVHVTQEVARGLVEECLAAHPRPWNLIVVGRHPVRGLRWLTGTTAVEVLEHSKSPLAVVPQDAPAGP